MINTNYLQKKVLIDCLEFLGRGQSPSYIEEESEILAINQKCVRNSTVDISYARAHNSRVIVKDNAILQNGDICINSTGTGTIGRIGLWSSESQIFDNQYFADSHVTVARPDKTKVNPKYLAALLESEKIQTSLETYCFSGSTNQIELNKAALSELSIEIIPIEAQHIVADILSTIDRAITQTEAIIAKQQRIKTGLMQDLLTKGIDENGNIRSEATHEFKDSAIGRIPVEWEVKELREVSLIIDPNPSHRYPPSSDVGVPIASTENFVGDNDFDLSFSEKVAFHIFKQQNQRCHFSKLDIIFARKGRLGFARYYGESEKVFSHTVVIFKPCDKQQLETSYLLWLVRFRDFFDQIDKRMNSNSGVPTLGVQFLGSIPVRVPKLSEQIQICLTLDSLEERIEEEKRNLSKQKRLKTGLMQDLLTGKIRVTPLLEKEPASR